MDMTYLAFTLGGIPLYVSRVFVTTFVAALVARHKPELFIEFPTWATRDEALAILGVLAFLEVASTKSPELAELFSTFDSWIKSGANLFYSQVLVGTGAVVVASTLTVHHAGFDGSSLVALGAAAAVWFLSTLRNRVLTFLMELDSDDSLGLRKLLSWAEDGWAGLGMILLVIFPLLALALSGVAVLVLVAVERLVAAREKRAKEPCPDCAQPNHPSAISCFHCRRQLENPRRAGIFGQPTEEPAGDLDQHRLELAGRRRCMVCAALLPSRSVKQSCASCGTEVFPSREWGERYLEHVRGKLPKTLAVCAAFSLVPFFGLIPGIIYYRLSLISSLRAYIPLTTGCLTRWFVRAVTLVLIAFQWVPGLGGIMLPLMCWINYVIYRRVLERETAIHLRPTVTA